ncbi:hypothetical protein CTAYLR_002845 [Chrysophaeum taylorii]|uniref:Uncharacterized protein n=1 Tax=Chrysophaeum taylorii TaxID=2483200 RepID=A0AAD7UA58_9STRA|nr:hypothetical protein CTAYLR_002845 [Chrysophaeum taylorii]
MAVVGSKTEAEWRRSALERMLRVEGFSVVIVCTGTEWQAKFWQARLERGKGYVIPATSDVVCVHEDWTTGGAGNGLGTLYAMRKAAAAYEGDLLGKLLSGEISVAVYHTAGKGTRLAPLPGAENNNKPGVKLPASAPVGEGGARVPLTILESVVKQTGVYAASRAGRASVFWGDQIFVPTLDTAYDAARAHADILCMLAPMPDARTWSEKGLEKYGLVAVSASGAACQIEKVDHATALEMTASLGEIESVGTSLGSFSVSAKLLQVLDAEFDEELSARAGSLDTDPHWWMPMTLPVEAYCKLMAKKGTEQADAMKHHARIQAMLAKFDDGGKHLLGPVDVGASAYWWDYGQLKLYLKNALRLVEDGVEADAMREFLGVARGALASSPAVKSDPETVATACDVGAGSTTSSVLANVTCAHIAVDEAVVVNCTARKIKAGKKSIAYNVVDDSDCLELEDGEVVTDVFQPDGTIVRQRSRIDVDGGKAWKLPVLDNKFSFEAVYKQNLATDIIATSALASKAHADLAAKLACDPQVA